MPRGPEVPDILQRESYCATVKGAKVDEMLGLLGTMLTDEQVAHLNADLLAATAHLNGNIDPAALP